MQDLTTIQSQLTSRALFDAFKMQLMKDFSQSRFPVDFIETLEPDYIGIHKKIVSELLKADTLMPLLNRIDISEMQLKKYLNEQKNRDRIEVIAELIIKRVLQKVVIRKFYNTEG